MSDDSDHYARAPVRVFARLDSRVGEWWFEVERDDPSVEPEVFHTDGMFPSREAAHDAGAAWAYSNGYRINYV